MSRQKLGKRDNSAIVLKRRRITPLKIAIIESGFTQKSIAALAGVTETIISLVANGKWNPDSIQKARIAAALDKSVNDLFPERY